MTLISLHEGSVSYSFHLLPSFKRIFFPRTWFNAAQWHNNLVFLPKGCVLFIDRIHLTSWPPYWRNNAFWTMHLWNSDYSHFLTGEGGHCKSFLCRYFNLNTLNKLNNLIPQPVQHHNNLRCRSHWNSWHALNNRLRGSVDKASHYTFFTSISEMSKWISDNSGQLQKFPNEFQIIQVNFR